MTDTLLIIIAVLLAVRIVLQVRQGKRAFEKMYCAPSEVENINVYSDKCRVEENLRKYSEQGFELVQVIDNYGGHRDVVMLFFTRKKIKNYYEN
ncbi:hypothetical protein [Clavibacter sp.]|uniref:hypothetical protein n=1 Tax=Clavibacter sp. TaxID=1871044 RepID=UPI0019AD9042|nr:hypothetical protein [Clavibacter sp.]MBD5382006.1 hypothetical protein [Clavibacter sp.]